MSQREASVGSDCLPDSACADVQGDRERSGEPGLWRGARLLEDVTKEEAKDGKRQCEDEDDQQSFS